MTFERIYSYAAEKAPQLAARNTHVIHEWLASGYNVEKDIIPAIDKAIRGGARTIQSFSYFSGFIRSNNEKRLKDEIKPKEVSKQEKDELRAKNIRWHRDKGVSSTSIGPSDFRWLEQYEQKEAQK